MIWQKDTTRLVEELFSGDHSSVVRARKKLVAMGDKAIPALQARLGKDDNESWYIGKVLREIGGGALSVLNNAMESGEPARRYGALRALWEFDAEAVSEVPLLIGLLDSTDAEVRWRAAHALGRIGHGASAAGNRLAEACSDTAPKVRSSALFALPRIGYDTRILAEICLDLFQTETDDDVFDSAVSAMAVTGNDPTPVGDIVVRRLAPLKPGRLLSSSWFELLRRCQHLSESSTATLVTLLNTPEIFFRNRVGLAEVLWRHTRDADLVMPPLMAMLSDEDGLESVCDTLCVLGPAAVAAVPHLMRELEACQDYWDFCWAAVDALGFIGPAASDALPLLERMRSHPSALVQKRVDKAIRRIHGEVIPEEGLEDH